MKNSILIILLSFLVTSFAPGQDCTASDGTDGVTIMGECYSIENTTAIDRSWDNDPGTIPPGIGLLTNLTYLNLCCNQLTGGYTARDRQSNQSDLYGFTLESAYSDSPGNRSSDQSDFFGSAYGCHWTPYR